MMSDRPSSSLWGRIPTECLSLIFSYDPTYHEVFAGVLRDIMMAVRDAYLERYARDFGYLGRYRCSFYDDVDLMSLGEVYVVSNYPDPEGDADPIFDKYHRRASYTKTARHPDIVALVRYRAFYEQ